MWKHKETHIFIIIFDMGFKDITYGLNLLVVFQLQIELQLQKNIPTCFVFFFHYTNKLVIILYLYMWINYLISNSLK